MEPVLSHVSLFHFIRPWFLLALIPAVLLFVLLWFRKPNYGSWHHVISPHLLPHLLQGTVKQQGKLPLVLLLIGWVITSIALAGPTWSKLPQTVQKKINAKVILLDLSLSMLAQDLKPSRLTRAQHKLNDILNQSEEGLTGLITYAGSSHVVSPLTDDTHTILSMVTSLSPEIMPIKGSNPVAAVERATELLQQAGISEGQILLITDDVPSNFVSKVKQFLNPSLTPVSVFAIGTSDGAPIPLSQGSFVKDRDGAIVVPKLNTQQLKATAKALNGRFSTVSSDDEDINYLLGENSRLLDDEMKDTDRDFDTWNEHGLFLVVLLLPLAAAAYRKGWLGMLIIPLIFSLSFPPSAEASPWDDLWSTKDQQGQKAWQNDQLEQATELFDNPEWKASAQYKNGDYKGSAETLTNHIASEAGNTADNHYNLGNALAKQQDFPGALSAYNKALELNPDMADAKSNQAIVEKLKKQQEQQQEQGNGNDDQQQNKDSNENDSKSDSQESEDQNKDKGDQQDQNASDQQNADQRDSDQQNQDNSDQSQQDQNNKNASDSQEEKNKQQQGSQQNEDEDNKEQTQSQQPKPRDDSEKELEQQASTRDIQESNLNKEDQQALEQWLRRIPDDPGGLLRRKFAQESKLRRNQPVEDKQW